MKIVLFLLLLAVVQCLGGARSEPPKSPMYYWAQTREKVFVRVDVKSLAEPPHVELGPRSVVYEAETNGGDVYELALELYGEVSLTESVYDQGDWSIQFELVKVDARRWPRLLAKKGKPANQRIDWTRYSDGDDADYDDEDDDDLGRNSTPSKKPPKQKKGTTASRANKEGGMATSEKQSDVIVSTIGVWILIFVGIAGGVLTRWQAATGGARDKAD